MPAAFSVGITTKSWARMKIAPLASHRSLYITGTHGMGERRHAPIYAISGADTDHFLKA